MIDIEEQVRCVRREIAMRQRVYPRWIEQGRMTEDQAAREINAMKAALDTLGEVARKQASFNLEKQ